MSKKNSFFLFSIVVVIILLIVFLLLPVDNSALPIDDNMQGTPRLEILKFLFQLLIIGIIGGTVAGIITTFFKNQEKKEAVKKECKKERKDFLELLIPIYLQVENIREILIAKRNTSPSMARHYCEQMELLDRSRKELKDLKIKAECTSAVAMLTKNENSISTLLSRMIVYLKPIILEYYVMETVTRVDYYILPKFDEFTSPAGNEYIENFSKPFEALKKIVSDNLV